MELASLKKKTLCSKIYDIHEKFVKIYNEFAELEYDILMPEEIQFTDHVIFFLAKVIYKCDNIYRAHYFIYIYIYIYNMLYM